ncbi:MAG: hypothetical protein KJ025_01025 [Burkholderiales bacterium]|nr:hypothetical protein [Burkholderiales bacterium]
MAQGSLYTELMNARTERQVAALVEQYVRRIADEHPRGFGAADDVGEALMPFLSAASRVRTSADLEVLHATVSGYVESLRTIGKVPPALAEVAEILAAARMRLKQLRRPMPG